MVGLFISYFTSAFRVNTTHISEHSLFLLQIMDNCGSDLADGPQLETLNYLPFGDWLPSLKEHLAKPHSTSEETCRHSAYVWTSHFNFQWFPRIVLSFKLPEVLDEVSVESPATFDPPSRACFLPYLPLLLNLNRCGATLLHAHLLYSWGSQLENPCWEEHVGGSSKQASVA